MVTVKKCKRILQASGKKYSDEETKQIRDELYRLASIVNDTKAIKNEES